MNRSITTYYFCFLLFRGRILQQKLKYTIEVLERQRRVKLERILGSSELLDGPHLQHLAQLYPEDFLLKQGINESFPTDSNNERAETDSREGIHFIHVLYIFLSLSHSSPVVVIYIQSLPFYLVIQKPNKPSPKKTKTETNAINPERRGE